MFLRSFVGLTLLSLGISLYCSSACIAHESVCNTSTFGDCTVCAVSIYSMVPNQTGCVLLNQTQVMNVDLTTPVSLSGFTSSSPTTFSCGVYEMSGQYGSGDFLQKTYQIGVPHYLLKVRLNLVFMGTWSNSDSIVVMIDGVNQKFPYTCLETTSICTPTDCFRIREANATHTNSTALVRFETTSTQAKSVAGWGIRDLMVVAKTCHSKCASCFGPNATDCYSCEAGSYLLGNACVEGCPIFSIASMRICVQSCPNGFYPITSTKSCQPCSSGCLACSGPNQSDCLAGNKDMWESKKQFWILLIVLVIVVIISAVACVIFQRRKAAKIMGLQEPMVVKGMATETNMDASLNKLPQTSMDFTMQQKTRTMNEIQVINLENSQQSSESSGSSNDSQGKKKKKPPKRALQRQESQFL